MPPALRSLCFVVERWLLCERRPGIPADARQRCHDQSSEPRSHTRPLGHLQWGKTLVVVVYKDWPQKLILYGLKTQLKSNVWIADDVNCLTWKPDCKTLLVKTVETVVLQEYTEENEDKAMSSLFHLVCQLYKVRIPPGNVLDAFVLTCGILSVVNVISCTVSENLNFLNVLLDVHVTLGCCGCNCVQGVKPPACTGAQVRLNRSFCWTQQTQL